MKILIAEDDVMLQTMAGTLMDRWGFEFDIVSNGREAVEQARLREGEYDLCLMDIDMPVMNGSVRNSVSLIKPPNLPRRLAEVEARP